MCSPAVYNTLLLFTVCTCLFLEVVGLPVPKQEPDSIDDLLAGKDFLQVLLDLPTTKSNLATPSTAATSPTSIELEDYPVNRPAIVREGRSTKSSTKTSFGNAEDVRKVVNVKISSKESRVYLRRNRIVTSTTTKTTTTTTEGNVSEEEEEDNERGMEMPVLHPERESIVAAANRHEFNVEEMEPITRDAEPGYTEELPANVQAIPVIKKLSDFEKTSELLKELSQEKLKDKLQPFHHTVIYHNDNNNKDSSSGGSNNNRRDSMIPRSLSYSAVVQNIQGDRWKNTEPTQPTENKFYASSSSEKTTESWGNQPKVPIVYGQPEQNYEVDEAVSVQTNGRTHGVQPTSQNSEKPSTKSKNGYVIEGRKERRYRVEERTPDGFIVGEFGIVNHDDGLLRGVRYTADETINPKLIYDTLMKFLSL